VHVYAQTQSAEFCGLVWSIALKCARLFGPSLKSGDAVMRTCEQLSFVRRLPMLLKPVVSNLSIASIEIGERGSTPKAVAHYHGGNVTE
jgi:hypothetical protein